MKIYNIKRQYNALSIHVKAALWFTVCNAVSKVGVLICTPIYTRLLTSEQYGEYAIWHSWNGIISAFTTLNLYNSSYMAGLTRYKRDKEGYTASMVGLTTIMSVIALFIYSRFIGCIGIQNKYTYAMLIEILFSAYFNFWAAYSRYHYEYIKLLCMTMLYSIFIILATTILPFLAPQTIRLDVRIFSEVTVWVITGFICLIMMIRKSYVIYNWKYWSAALKQNVPLIPHYLSATILNQSDRIMIGKYCGKTETAYYNLAYTISLMMLIVTNAVKNSLDPYFYKAIKEREGITELSKKINLIFVAVMFFCIVSIAIAPELILIFAPLDYFEARYVIPPLAVSVFFVFAYNVFSCVEFYYGKTKNIMLISFLGAMVNVGLNILMIPVLGYKCAGYTTLFSYIIFAAGHLFISWRIAKENGIDGIYEIKSILSLFVLLLVIMEVYGFLYDFVFIRYVSLLICLFIIVKKKILYSMLHL